MLEPADPHRARPLGHGKYHQAIGQVLAGLNVFTQVGPASLVMPLAGPKLKIISDIGQEYVRAYSLLQKHAVFIPGLVPHRAELLIPFDEFQGWSTMIL